MENFEWLMDEKEFIETEKEFNKVKKTLVLYKDGNVYGINDWNVKKVTKEKKEGFFKRKTVTKTYWVIEKITFFCGEDGEAKMWAGSNLMCTPMGINGLVNARERFVKMRRQLRNLI